MATLLEQLETMTIVVADTGDFNSIAEFKPRDATTNPTLLATAAQMPEYRQLVDNALRWAAKAAPAGAPLKVVVDLAIDRLFIEFGLRILQIIPGRVSTEVDARLSYDTRASIDKARALIKMYEEAGMSRERILIKLASTWEGIRAAEVLEQEGIHCNMTLMFGLHQAVACAEAGATLISPFVGRILDWYKKNTGRESYPPAEDPGVLSVTRIYDYFKKFGHKTQVMGASFRNVEEIIELAGCDLLTISPQLLQELAARSGTLTRKLDPEKSKAKKVDRIVVDEATFRKMHEADKMAHDKLDEGIQGFSKAVVALEKLLEERFKALDGKVRVGDAARAFFKVYDLDGDGFITREEWGGTAAVFWALDANHDGKISPEEMAAGLGIAFLLEEGAK